MKRKMSASVLGKTELSRGFLKVSLYELEVERHEGGTRRIKWEVMERGHSVSVLPYDPKLDVVVLCNECRPGALVAGDYPYTDNLVSGVIGKDEVPIDAAVREMQEEVDLVLRDAEVIHPGAYVSSGGTSEKVILVFGKVDASHAGGIHGNASERENILTVVLPALEFIERARSGNINDLKTALAGYWLAEHRDRIRQASA